MLQRVLVAIAFLAVLGGIGFAYENFRLAAQPQQIAAPASPAVPVVVVVFVVRVAVLGCDVQVPTGSPVNEKG